MKERKTTQKLSQTMQDAWQCEKSVQEQDELFNQYAEVQLRDYASRGRNIKPMTIQLSKKEKLMGLI